MPVEVSFADWLFFVMTVLLELLWVYDYSDGISLVLLFHVFKTDIPHLGIFYFTDWFPHRWGSQVFF